MKRVLLTLGLLSLALGGVGQARAGLILVYDNGPVTGSIDGFNISDFLVTDSFSVSSPATITKATIGVWAAPGDRLTRLDWAVGTTAYGSDIASGTAISISNTYQTTNPYGFDIFEATFALQAPVASGTYWLTLQNAHSTNGSSLFWDESNGPSAGFSSGIGDLANYDLPNTTGSESFQLYRPGLVTAEPSDLTVLATAVLSFAGYFGWRGRKRWANA